MSGVEWDWRECALVQVSGPTPKRCNSGPASAWWVGSLLRSWSCEETLAWFKVGHQVGTIDDPYRTPHLASKLVRIAIGAMPAARGSR
jgi:hypothetical protein